MNFTELVQSKNFKKFLTKLYSIGASVVIIGALFKIQHWPMADLMLCVGLLTEAVIFFFFSFDNSDDEAAATLPKIIPTHSYETVELPLGGQNTGAIGGSVGSGSLALAKFDELLENADITPEMFHKLGEGMRKLGESTANINSIGDISAASLKYMNTIQNADESLGKLAKSYQSSIVKVITKTGFNYKNITESLSAIEEGAKSYQQQLETLNKNLSALNSVYVLQKKEADNYLKDLLESADDSRKYKEQIKTLNNNLSALNSVYGNMLTAMKVK